ncbi:hypothetical protein SAMN04244547_05158 [Azotobacter vinelandii]|nr:hypothetical protein SAMN04244547_05158 [Azotobacter vinelandii]
MRSAPYPFIPYKKAGKNGQRIAGHTSKEMTKSYQQNHADIAWSNAVPDIAEISR